MTVLIPYPNAQTELTALTASLARSGASAIGVNIGTGIKKSLETAMSLYNTNATVYNAAENSGAHTAALNALHANVVGATALVTALGGSVTGADDFAKAASAIGFLQGKRQDAVVSALTQSVNAATTTIAPSTSDQDTIIAESVNFRTYLDAT